MHHQPGIAYADAGPPAHGGAQGTNQSHAEDQGEEEQSQRRESVAKLGNDEKDPEQKATERNGLEEIVGRKVSDGERAVHQRDEVEEQAAGEGSEGGGEERLFASKDCRETRKQSDRVKHDRNAKPKDGHFEHELFQYNGLTGIYALANQPAYLVITSFAPSRGWFVLGTEEKSPMSFCFWAHRR